MEIITPKIWSHINLRFKGISTAVTLTYIKKTRHSRVGFGFTVVSGMKRQPPAPGVHLMPGTAYNFEPAVQQD